MRVKGLILAALAMCLAAAPVRAAAQDTGSVSGAIFDQNGAPVADAMVRIVGDQMPAGRSVKSDDNGAFRFQLLLPGRYVVEVEKPGVGKSSRPAIIEVSKDTQLDLVIGVTVSEELTISAATPAVDLKSTEVNFNYGAAQIESLPLPRSYSGLFQLIPGVAENNSFAPSGGASRQDNKYLMDGVDITNPGFGYLSSEVNDLDIAEFNVKRGAITAEFGRASGFVTNAVSKSGTNQLRGTFKAELRPTSFNADSNTLNSAGDIIETASTTDRYLAGFSLGGPLMRDRLFWYGSGQWIRSKTTDRTNALGPVPDSTATTQEIFGKLTGQPNATMFVNAGFRYRPNQCDLCGIGNQDSPDVARDSEGDNKIVTATWNWFPSASTVFDARYIHMEENAMSIAVRDLGFKPAFNPGDLANMGQFTDTSGAFNVIRGAHNLLSDEADYKRDEFRATMTQFFDLGTSAHQFKAGFGFEEGSEKLERHSNGWGILAIVGTGGSQIQGTYYPDQPAQVSPGRTYSIFVQDDITIGSRFVVNAGLLVNRDEFSQTLASKNTFLTFDFKDEIQPRIGANYQIRKGVGDKAYANWGRYYNMDQKSSARSLAPARLFFNDALFDRATGALISDAPRASTTGKLINPGLKPTYTDEWLVGYATPLVANWTVDIFYVNRESFDFLEDVPSSLPATGPFRAAQLDGAERKYKALTIELGRRLANHWSMTASYAWSRLEGNFDLDYSTGAVFNTSSAIQDGPGEFVQDQYRYGPLSQDRPHVFKLFASYMPPVVPNLTLGGYLRAQSGTPWAARGIDWDNGVRRYLEPAGSRRVDSWTNFDLLAAYRLPIGPRAGLKIEGRVLNVFDDLATLSVDQRQFRDPRIRPAASAFAVCGTDYACATEIFSAAQTTNQPNALFGQANDWAPPRRFLLTAQIDF
jgi:hypothetical protein